MRTARKASNRSIMSSLLHPRNSSTLAAVLRGREPSASGQNRLRRRGNAGRVPMRLESPANRRNQGAHDGRQIRARAYARYVAGPQLGEQRSRYRSRVAGAAGSLLGPLLVSAASGSQIESAPTATKRKRSAGSAGRGGRSDSRESARPDPPSRRVLSWPDTGCRRSSGLSLGACRPAVMQLVPGGSDVAAIAAKRLSQGKAALPLHRCSLRTAASGSACQRRSRLAVRLVDRDTRQPRSIARRR